MVAIFDLPLIRVANSLPRAWQLFRKQVHEVFFIVHFPVEAYTEMALIISTKS